MHAVFAQYGKGLPKFKSAHQKRETAAKVAARIEATGIKASVFEVERVKDENCKDV